MIIYIIILFLLIALFATVFLWIRSKTGYKTKCNELSILFYGGGIHKNKIKLYNKNNVYNKSFYNNYQNIYYTDNLSNIYSGINNINKIINSHHNEEYYKNIYQFQFKTSSKPISNTYSNPISSSNLSSNTTMIGGNLNNPILELMSKSRYDALNKIFLELGFITESVDYELYRQESPKFRNEVGYFITKSNKSISHHYPGDSFRDTLQNMNGDYFILDDVVGFNNLIGATQTDFKLNIPPFINSYVLNGYIDKAYNVSIIDYQKYQYPSVIPKYNLEKKSFPYYMHGFYKKINFTPTIEASNEYLKFVIPTLRNVSSKLYIPPPVKTFPHYGGDCVFNSLISMLCFVKEDLIKEYLRQGKNYELVRLMSTTDHTYSTQKLEAEFGQSDFSKPYDIQILFNSKDLCSKFFAEPYIMYYNDLNNISNNTKYVVAYVHEPEKYQNLKPIGIALGISRAGPWIMFFHQVALKIDDDYIADDMTYNPVKISREEICDITIFKNYGLYLNLNYSGNN